MNATTPLTHSVYTIPGCELCESAGGSVVFQNAVLRVIHAHEPAYPGFYRVVWNAHVPEWSDLQAADRMYAMDAVVIVEKALRQALEPRKVNVASLGNVTAHLHWHVIARFDWDAHYPAPVWAQPQRALDTAAMQTQLAVITAQLPQVNEQIQTALAAAGY